MRIRKARHVDIPKIIPIVKAFHEEALKPFGMGFDMCSVEATISGFIADHIGLVVEAGDPAVIIGCIGGAVIPSFTDYSQKIFVESIWYLLPEFRGGRAGVYLLDMVEEYCRRNGITKIVMVGMADPRIEKLSKFYLWRGYKKLELHFVKELTDAK